MQIENVSWHDGVIDAFSFDQEGNILLDCRLYLTMDDSKRCRVGLKISAVTRMSVDIDAEALRDNRQSGNISDGRYLVAQSTASLKLFLSDGLIWIEGKSIEMNLDETSDELSRDIGN